MKRIEYLARIAGLFRFKTVTDDGGNEFVLYADSPIKRVERIRDRTAFEAVENHVHLIDNVKKEEFDELIPMAKALGQALLNVLKCQYPHKSFIVFASLCLHDSMIIRFHQKWDNELPYYDPSAFVSAKELVFSFEE